MFRGTFTALVTPFTADGQIDEISLRRHVDEQIDAGVSGLVPCGTTGESPTLSHDEHNRVIEIVVKQAKKRVPVIAGTGSNSTREAIALTENAKKIGADAALVVTPYYNKPTQHALLEHFLAIADVGLPVVLYNIKGRTGINIETSTVIKLAGHQNIVGVKEASGDINQIMDVIRERPDRFCVLSGDDNLSLPLIAVGGDGVISVISNIIPARVSEFISICLEGSFEEARTEQYELLPLFKAMFLETNPVPVKAALAMMGKIEEKYRMPMSPLLPENKEKLRRLLSDYGLVK